MIRIILSSIIFLLISCTTLALEMRLNALKIVDKNQISDQYVYVSKVGNDLHFEVCELDTDDCYLWVSLPVKIIESLKREASYGGAGPAFIAVTGALIIGVDIISTQSISYSSVIGFSSIIGSCFWGISVTGDLTVATHMQQALSAFNNCTVREEGLLQLENFKEFMHSLESFL